MISLGCFYLYMLNSLTKNLTAPFLPKNFVIPLNLETPDFKIKKLSTAMVEKDYEAVMSSLDRLKGIFGPYEPAWPPPTLTLEEDYADLKWHEEEFNKRTSFAYTVLDSTESACLGCVYIFPSPNINYEAMVFLWTINNQNHELDQKLYQTVKGWLNSSWPFHSVAYPGREIAWDKWNPS